MRGVRWAAHTFSGSMNSSPHPRSFIHLGPGAGGKKEGAPLGLEHVDCGAVWEGTPPPPPPLCPALRLSPTGLGFGLRPGLGDDSGQNALPALDRYLLSPMGHRGRGGLLRGCCTWWQGPGSGVVWKWDRKSLALLGSLRHHCLLLVTPSLAWSLIPLFHLCSSLAATPEALL